MRNVVEGKVLKARAIGGLHVVTLAWDFVGAKLPRRKGSLGLCYRARRIRQGQEVSRATTSCEGLNALSKRTKAWLRARRSRRRNIRSSRFNGATTPRNPIPPTICSHSLPTGKPKLMELDRDSATTIEITTEAEVEAGPKGETRHNIYFNRGVAGSQAYARKVWKNTRPMKTNPNQSR